jgi:citrate lyase subunit beta / citryl-CoA lyase
MKGSSRLRRSELSRQRLSTRMIATAAAADADLVFLDLEDAVARSERVEPRETLVAGLNDLLAQ